MFQLDICEKMAEYIARTAAGYIVWIAVSLSVDGCGFSGHCSYHLGKLADWDIGPRYRWFGSHYGWDCSLIGFLFNYALVENTMAKLKYVFPFFFSS